MAGNVKAWAWQTFAGRKCFTPSADDDVRGALNDFLGGWAAVTWRRGLARSAEDASPPASVIVPRDPA